MSSFPPRVPKHIEPRLRIRGLTGEDIDQKCANDNDIIASISAEFSEWRNTAPYLDIRRAEIKEIERDSSNERDCKFQVLHTWIKKKGDQATYANLIIALDKDENMELIDLVLELLKKKKDLQAMNRVDLEPLKEADLKFYCGCGQCSFEDYVANRCRLPWRCHAYPILNITDLAAHQKLHLFSRLQHEYEDVKEKFAFLVSCQILPAFQEKYGEGAKIVKKLIVFILAKQPFLFLDEASKRRVHSNLHKAQTIGDVFGVVMSNFMSWFNHLLLGSITKSFGVARQPYRNYVDHTLARFLQRSLFEIPKDSFSPDSPEGSGLFILKFEVTSPVEELPGSILLPLRRHVASKLSITIDSFTVRSYNSGCFYLNIAGPQELLETVFPLSTDGLSELGALPVTCKGLRLVSIEYQNNRQTVKNPQIKRIDDLHDSDMHSTPLSSVESLFTCLLLKMFELDESHLIHVLRGIQTYKLSIKDNKALITGVINWLPSTVIQEVTSYMSFFNYFILETVLKRHHDSDLRKYITQLENLKIADLPLLLHHTKSVANFSNDPFVFEFQPDVKSVEDLNCIRQTFCNLYQLEQHSVIVYSLDKQRCELRCLVVKAAMEDVLNLPDYGTAFAFRLKESKVVRVSYQGNVLLDLSNIEDDSGMSSGTVSEDESPLRHRNINPRQSLTTPPPIELNKLSFDQMKVNLKEESPPEVIRDAFTKEKKEERGGVMDMATEMTTDSLLGVSLYDGESEKSPSFPQPFPIIPTDSTDYHDWYMEQVMNQYRMYPPPHPPSTTTPYPFPLHPSLPHTTHVYPPPEFTLNPLGAPFVNVPESHLAEEWPDVQQVQDKTPSQPSPTQLLAGSYTHESNAIPSKIKQGPIRVCKPCLSLEYSCEELAKHYCLKPFAHEGKPEAFVVWDRDRQQLLEVPSSDLINNTITSQSGMSPLSPADSLKSSSFGSLGYYSGSSSLLISGQQRYYQSPSEPTIPAPVPAKVIPAKVVPVNIQAPVPAHVPAKVVPVNIQAPVPAHVPAKVVPANPVHISVPSKQGPLANQIPGKLSELSISDNNHSKSFQKVNNERKSVPPKVTLPEKKPTPIPTPTPVVMATNNRTKPEFQSMPTQFQPTTPSTDAIFKERNEWKCKFQERLKQSPNIFLDDYGDELTRRNYRDKFYQLLCYEESEHITLLTEKCDGQYEFMFYGQEQTKRGQGRTYIILELGCIRGMNGDQVQYATQASEGLYLLDPDTGTDICSAQVSESNYKHMIGEDFQVELSPEKAADFRRANSKMVRGNWYRVGVEFEVKHSYFDTLHRAIVSVPQVIIDKIVPAQIKAPPSLNITDLKAACDRENNLTVDGFGQLKALEAILSLSASVPLILSGPFGSGKTRVLARSAFEIGIMALRTGKKARILICAHHYETVNMYKKYLTSAFRDVQRVKVIKIVRKRNQFKFQDNSPQQHSSIYHEITLFDFKSNIENGAYMNDRCIIVMATYMTSLKISDVLSSKMCSFTHVLLDEVAQVREPEAVSSLCAANKFTKVIIAGDSKQVGPYVVVLGDQAREHGLQKSLLERLEALYISLGPPISQYIHRLTINYRCHPILTRLLSSTLYNDYPNPITCGATQFVTHPLSPRSPCVFHCYDVTNLPSDRLCEWGGDGKHRMELEADVLIGQLTKYLKIMTYTRQFQNKDICVISPNRNQLNLIEEKLSFNYKRRVLLLPSYNVQGHEFEAIFVSTLEHLDDDGTPSNPTKSLVTPRIFNTVLSRSKSLVVAVGNPYALMEIEKKMGCPEKCWHKYIKSCLENDSVTYEGEVIGIDKINKELRSKVGASPAAQSRRVKSPVKQTKTGSTSDQYDDGSQWQTVQPRAKSPHQSTGGSGKGWSYPGTDGNSGQKKKPPGAGMSGYYRSGYSGDKGRRGDGSYTRQNSQDGRQLTTPTYSRSKQYHSNNKRNPVGGDGEGGFRPTEQLSIGDYITTTNLTQSAKRRHRKKKK